MIPMSSSSSHNTSRRRPSATNLPRRRPLVRSNSSLLGTIKNIVTAPLTWFATQDDFEDSPDLKGKRRRNALPGSGSATDYSEGPPRTKRARVKSPDRIQFHPEPVYVAPAYTNPPTSSAYLDPPGSVFDNQSNFYRSNSINMSTPSLAQFKSNNRSGLTRTMSIDPPHNPVPLSRDATMNFTPLDRDTSIESSSFIRTSSSIPRDLSMPLPATRSSFRIRTSLTPQPTQPREVSEPPPLSSLAQKPVFVRQPPDSHQRLSSQSSSSTLGSLVESQRSTRSPMRQHSSLLFGSGPGLHSQSSEANGTHQPAPAERALHELDVYKTPLLPTRSRLRSNASSPSHPSFPQNIPDPSDMFRPRRSSLLLMRDDRRASASGRKSSYSFLDVEEVKDKDLGKLKKVNETKPYAGEGGMKKLLARRMKEVQEDDEDHNESHTRPPAEEPGANREELSRSVPPPVPADWGKETLPRQASTGSSLRVGRTKTSRTHIARPGRPSKKFSAAFEEDGDESMEDIENVERQKERQELEEAAKRLPVFAVPSGFSFAKEPNVASVEHDASAKEPPIAVLPFSFGNPSAAAEPVDPISTPAPATAAISKPQPKPPTSSFSFDRGPVAGPSTVANPTTDSYKPSKPEGVPNFFASSKLLSAAPSTGSLLPSAIPSFGLSDPTPLSSPSTDPVTVPKPSTTMLFPSTPAPAPSITPTSTPLKDSDNPFWEGEKSSTGPQPSLFRSKTNGSSMGDNDSTNPSSFGVSNSTSTQPVSIFGGETKDDPAASSMFGASTTSGFPFSKPFGGEGTAALTSPPLETSKAGQHDEPKPIMPFGSLTANSSTPAVSEPSKPSMFAFGQASTAPAADAAKPSMFGAQAPVPNMFASTAASDPPKPAFGGFTFGQPKEAPKSAPDTPASFAFGAPPSASTSTAAAEPAPFTFGSAVPSAPASSGTFSFGAPAEPKPVTPAAGMFSFGTPTVIPPSARPVTPPRNEMQEFKMEESPTREMQVNTEVKPAEPRPTLGGGGGGFSFGNPSSGSLFGQTSGAPAPAPFSFGSPSNSNTFGASAPTENKSFGGAEFGRPASTSNPFAFGQNNAPSSSIDPSRPLTTGSFSFQASGPPGTTSFGFGGGNPTNGNPFASASGGSAPNSPSTFNQPFSFGAPAPQQTGSFSFGSSQPVSPAGGPSSLPQPTTPGGFGGGFGAQPSSPFSAGGVQPPQQTAGGSLFTIGAPPPPAAPGPRPLKKLPRRKN
ncbi:hypothetical protein B0H15DRAFT_251991 [Mycena belliarum]|uniref:Uncharacterized protein n=1 Tax=Mycena belliarum TaxID=1033014 RepID=A0AAD6U6W5_9AGAR|nr:hypothetical protein B0H15DRAFT_251991 [Mycena belliae]